MTLFLSPLDGVTFNDEVDEAICDYDFISDDDFILVLVLTTKANIFVYHKTGNSLRLESISFNKLFPKGDHQPSLISITPDASLISLILDDGITIVLIPFSAIMVYLKFFSYFL
jgi:hypothetical protein